MNKSAVEQFVTRYLQATQCHIIEKSPAHMRVRLSVEADKALTGRPYYWSFVERTGAEPETMTFVFVFDPEAYVQSTNDGRSAAANNRHQQPFGQASVPQGETRLPGGAGATGHAGASGVIANLSGSAAGPSSGASATGVQNGESILARYFGFAPTTVRREPQETMTFGCSRLQQIFADVQERGKFVVMFEENDNEFRRNEYAGEYVPWLGVNFKVEFTCDLKRDEIHSLGISLASGEIVDRFHEKVCDRKLTPRIPAQAKLQKKIPLYQAAVDLENDVEKKLIACDHRWADEAMERFHAEYKRIETYFGHLLNSGEPSEHEAIREQMEAKINEIERQFRPRIHVSVINCGIFHLRPDSIRQRNRARADTF